MCGWDFCIPPTKADLVANERDVQKNDSDLTNLTAHHQAPGSILTKQWKLLRFTQKLRFSIKFIIQTPQLSVRMRHLSKWNNFLLPNSKIRQFFDLAVRHGLGKKSMFQSTTSKFGSPGCRGTNRLLPGKLNVRGSFAVNTHNVQSRRKHGRSKDAEWIPFLGANYCLRERLQFHWIPMNWCPLKDLHEGQIKLVRVVYQLDGIGLYVYTGYMSSY